MHPNVRESCVASSLCLFEVWQGLLGPTARALALLLISSASRSSTAHSNGIEHGRTDDEVSTRDAQLPPIIGCLLLLIIAIVAEANTNTLCKTHQGYRQACSGGSKC